jgi:hypothetical protein
MDALSRHDRTTDRAPAFARDADRLALQTGSPVDVVNHRHIVTTYRRRLT